MRKGPKTMIGLAVGGLALVGGIVALVAASGRRSSSLAPTPGPAPAPDPTPDPSPPDPPAPDPKPSPDLQPDDAPGLPSIPGVEIVDLRADAPAAYIRQQRAPGDIRAIVLHQTAFSWKPDNPLWADVRAHFVVRRDGSIVCNFLPTIQMKVGSSHANPFSITVEIEGNYPSDAGKCWKPETYGCNTLASEPKLINAARRLIEALKQQYPSITHIYAHRQWEGADGKPNCPGPDIWRAIGRWAMNTLGLKDNGPGWHYDKGLAIPDSWEKPWPENYA
jgi:hypothetical protein